MTEELVTNESVILSKLQTNFPGKFVRKDLTKLIKEGANVPTYVLEYLLGMYANSTDQEEIDKGVQNVKNILSRNYVRPDEAGKVLSKLRENGSYTVIDRLTVSLNYRVDQYEVAFSNLGLHGVPVDAIYPSKYERLLGGGIWAIVQMEYAHEEDLRGDYDQKEGKANDGMPFIIRDITPIQMPGMDIDELKRGREQFTKDEWIDVVLRTTGMEPTQFSYREKMLHLLRLVPLIENNFNFVELGPRGTGKSHVYKEISPNSILVSGGQTTVANLFYNMASRSIGLVGMWDTVAFDEVAGITFKDKDGIQIMKDYMASGSFARGKEEKSASASMAFVGNINQSVDVVLRTSHLFDPFPDAMANDSAFLDRIHAYLPGWEIPKYRPDYFTNGYGFITDYFSEVMRELRKVSYADAINKYFKLGNQLNQRDTIGVKKIVSGMLKLIYPNEQYSRDDVEEVLRFALEMRRRVKEQLKKIGGMEFFDVNFSYIDNTTFEEQFVPVPEQGGATLIPEGMGMPGHVYSVAHDPTGRLSLYKTETQMSIGTGKYSVTGVSGRSATEATRTAYNYLKANASTISGKISLTNHDFVLNIQNLNGYDMTHDLALSTLIALVSAALSKPAIDSLVILGTMTIGGTLQRVDDLADTLQVAHDSGAKKVLLPMASAADLGTVPPELMSTFSILFYSSVEDGVFKALGVN
ncbi:protease Lon-related BREX system protein BrxL [Leuconostoc lactis]|uniref:protease Lon-related BREX system protein BrxL n=1 Tax=Leuconostoc lactis TaxID=1246 RepID=UPI000814CC5D|nr:protease Lon-related BREX system protein BrxL [Leuconostoc lactis]ANY11647.1 TIGR02688 family protein [Leuconostoc lactis]MSB66833.1 protease Lon-related BREX system protein BrxL [Leuconostoc lactis]RYS87453.1 protease Lon-related BREX system protein BrxL [Leuconostoc lactis]